MISIESLTVHYDDHLAVNDLSLTIDEGARFGLLGPNGAGKSTTIRCIAGLHRPSAGKITVAGVDAIAHPEEAKKLLGVVPQELALYPDLSVLENLRFFASLMGLKGKQRRARISWGLELSQLSHKAKAKVGALSGGMKRRLNLACSLLHEPKIIICDEPTTGVDPQSRNHIFDTIRSLQGEGATVVYTTHYMEEVEALCEEVAIIDQGKIIARDSLEGLLKDDSQASEYTLRFDARVTQEALEEALRALRAREIQAKARTLEAVFLDLTGRQLRESSK